MNALVRVLRKRDIDASMEDLFSLAREESKKLTSTTQACAPFLNSGVSQKENEIVRDSP